MYARFAERQGQVDGMSKCLASQDGICRNAYAFGLPCNGYSKECKLRPAYDNLEAVRNAVINSIRKSLGIVSDKGR